MDKQQKIIISALTVVLAVLIGVLVMLPAAVQDTGTVQGQFVPPDHDSAALSGVPEVDDAARQFSWLQMGDHIRLALCGSPALTGEGIELYFTSDSGNTAWLLVKILDENGEELGRSGLVYPGEYVRFVALEGAQSGMTVTVKILSYEPETYYSLGSASAVIQIP